MEENELSATITVAANRQKLQLSGKMDLPKTRDVNVSLLNLGFIETYPIGCRRYYAALAVDSVTAQTILKEFGFQVGIEKINGNLL